MRYNFNITTYVIVTLVLILISIGEGFSQQQNIRVLNEYGKPIDGATVQLDNKVYNTNDKGIVTFDLDRFPMEVLVEFIGYERQIVILKELSADLISISMTALSTIVDSVFVNTGYAQFKKHTNVGSFEVVSSEAILKENVPFNIIDALEDRVSSVSVDRRTNFGSLMVRGLSTIRGDRTPLIVLDNFPYEGNLENINPNDIENITVLKDASAASIWGARASNGVIVITTKKGTEGQKLRIEMSSNQQVIQKPDIYYRRAVPNNELIAVERFLFDNNYYTSRENQASKPALSPVVELLIANRDGRLSDGGLQEALQGLERNDLRDDFYNHVYRLGHNSQYTLRLSRNNNPVQWSFSGGFDQNEDYLHTQTKRGTATLNLRSSLSDRVNMELNMGFTHMLQSGGRDDLPALNDAWGNATNYYSIMDDNGVSLPVIRDYRQWYKDGLRDQPVLDWNYYPLEEHKWRELNNSLNSLRMQAGITYEILPKLELKNLFRYDQDLGLTDNIQHQESYSARDLINRYTVVNPDGAIRRVVPEGSIRSMFNSNMKTYNYRGSLSYERKWRAHTLSLQSGMDISSRRTDNGSQVLYGFNPHNYTNALVDLVNNYPSFIDGSIQSLQNNVGLEKLVRNTVSQYGYLRYNYDERYELFGTLRRDASNLFGVSTNRKWNPFWSIGGGWTVSAEEFYPLSDIVPWLRLRATNGSAGNVSERMAAATTISYNSVSNLTGVPFANFSNYYNPELTWEETRTLNLGLDFRTVRNLMEGSVEFYRKKASQLYGNAPIDYTNGVGYTITKNVADMEAVGFDASLKTNIPVSPAITWSIGVFANYYRDKVINYYQTSDRGSSYVSGIGITAIEGHPVHALYSYNFFGLDSEGNAKGIFEGEESTDYRRLVGTAVTIDDLVYAGQIFPKWSGALDQSIRYKKLTLNMRFSYRFGNVFRRETISYANMFASRLSHIDFTNRWQNPGDELYTSIPKMDYPTNANRDAFYANSTHTVTKGDLIRLNNIGISYRDILFKNKNVDLGFQINNLGLLYRANDANLDPEFLDMPPASIYQFRLSIQL